VAIKALTCQEKNFKSGKWKIIISELAKWIE
jgi:hypothetical protein